MSSFFICTNRKIFHKSHNSASSNSMDTIAETIKFAGFGKKKTMAIKIQMFDDRLTEQGDHY